MQPSFRDPEGRVWVLDDRVVRAVAPEASDRVTAFLESSAATDLLERGLLVPTRVLESAVQEVEPAGDADSLWLEHDRIAFPSYPHEWPAEMLWAAGNATLDVADRMLHEGQGLKDATPYNVLFRGARPVFIDLLSVENRDLEDPIWLPYAQFQRTFLLPLFARRVSGLAVHETFLTHRDGLEPEAVYRMCGPVRRLFPPALGMISIPTWFNRRQGPANGAEPTIAQQKMPAERTRFVLTHTFGRLRRSLGKMRPSAQSSDWTDYTETNTYSSDTLSKKERFVTDALRSSSATSVLDVGCNTGAFSRLAASTGASVVAIDYDPAVVGDLWRRAHDESADILPLVVDIARPTPAIGWRNGECASFLDRARKRFDHVLMLAVLHHLLVTERIPLDEVLALAADLTTSHVTLELVLPEDPQFQRIARGRTHLHEDLTVEAFEATATRRFNIEARIDLSPQPRHLYALSLKN